MIFIDWSKQPKYLHYIFITAIFLVVLRVLLGMFFDQGDVGSRMTQAQWMSVQINQKQMRIEVVSTANDIKQGLGDRDQIPLDQGMLFVFAAPSPYAFWMRHMRFPIDIVWLRDGKIVDIAYDMQPPRWFWSIPATYKPKAEADMVLEVVAGQAEVYGLGVGGEVDGLTEFKK